MPLPSAPGHTVQQLTAHPIGSKAAALAATRPALVWRLALVWLLAVAAVLCGRLPPARGQAAVDEEVQFRADVAALAAQPTRTPGSRGYRAAADYLGQQIAPGDRPLPNVQLKRQDFPILVPQTDLAQLTLPGRPTVSIYPLLPAGVRVNATPPGGITGHLVYCGDAALSALSPARLDGQIAVLETTAGDRWTTVVNLGARAVVLLGSAQTTNVELRPHDLPVPVNFPRFYLPPGPLSDDLRHGRTPAEAATLTAVVNWRPAVGTNLLALIVPPVAGPGAAGASAALAITVPYDSSSLVPDLAPAASQAVQAACGLALLRDWSRHPPAKPVLICFTGGDSTAFLATRHLLLAMTDPPAAWAPERDELSAQRDALSAQLARAQDAVDRPAALDPVADRGLIDRLTKIIELRELFVQDQLFAARDVRPGSETPAQRSARLALEEQRALLNRAAYAFRQRPADLASPELAPVAADVCRQAIDALTGTPDAPGGQIGDVTHRLAELTQRADLYRWLATAEHRLADPQPADASYYYLLELMVGLDLTDRGYRAGPITYGRFCRSHTNTDVQHYAEWFTNAATASPPWMKDVVPTVDLSTLGSALAQDSWMPARRRSPARWARRSACRRCRS